jgi:mRNA degradation ribonuclease J1/J2
VLHERAALASQGAAHVTIAIDELGRPAGEVALTTRGVVDETLDAHLLASARNDALAAVEALAEGGGTVGGGRVPPVEEISEAARQAVRRALGRVLGFKPLTTVTVLRIRR